MSSASAKAYEIWLEEGQPHRRDKDHWELAKFIIAQQDALETTLVPLTLPQPEPIEALTNQGEFLT